MNARPKEQIRCFRCGGVIDPVTKHRCPYPPAAWVRFKRWWLDKRFSYRDLLVITVASAVLRGLVSLFWS